MILAKNIGPEIFNLSNLKSFFCRLKRMREYNSSTTSSNKNSTPSAATQIVVVAKQFSNQQYAVSTEPHNRDDVKSKNCGGGTQLRKKVLLLWGPKIGRSNWPPCTFCTASPARSFTRPEEQMGTLGICPQLLFADIYLYSLDLKKFPTGLNSHLH